MNAAIAAGALVGSLLTVGAASAAPTPAGAPAGTAPAYQNAGLPVQQRVADLLGRMTLAEKIGQMTQAERGAVTGDPSLVTTWGLGSLLSGGGSTPTPNTPQAWADMVDTFQRAALATRLHIPLIYGVDSVHGHGNLVGATVFPHNIGLAATRDPALVERVEHVTAAETRPTGPQQVFAPCVCVARDDRWGRTYESFGEDPALVVSMETAIDGFQGPRASQLSRPDRVLSTAKHFAGDGDTVYGTATGSYKIDQGIAITNRADFNRLALAPYGPAVREHRVGSVMPSYSSVDWTEDGVGNPIKMHANGELITGVLKQQLGLDGFVVSDWEGIHQLPGDYAAQVRTGVNAGTDLFMEPFSYQAFETTLTAEVNAGRVSMSRVDDAVRRILTEKFRLGLFEHPFADRSGLAQVGSAQHRAVARQAVAESQVLLKNADRTLPLSGREHIYVAGANANDMGNQAGGWTVTGQLGEIDALVASWLPGSEGAGVADVLFGRRPFSGRLPQSWPASEAQEPINVGDANYQPLFPFGWGIGTGGQRGRLTALRTAAQQAMIAGRAAPDAVALFALAEQAQLAGQPERAAGLLMRAARR